MYRLIFDNNYLQYHPLVNLSEIDLFEINLKKFKQLYVFIDKINVFYKIYKFFTDNCIFVYNSNVYFKVDNFIIENHIFDLNKDVEDFREKIIRHDFIKDYLKGI
jgi:hypothetical protein